MPARRSANTLELLDRRGQVFLRYLEGDSVVDIAREMSLSHDCVQVDIKAMFDLMSKFDGLENVSVTRKRLIQSLWEEVSLGHSLEQEAISDSREEPDFRAASAYQANRLKAIAQISKLMGLEKSPPIDSGKRSWVDLMRDAAAKLGKS